MKRYAIVTVSEGTTYYLKCVDHKMLKDRYNIAYYDKKRKKKPEDQDENVEPTATYTEHLEQAITFETAEEALDVISALEVLRFAGVREVR